MSHHSSLPLPHVHDHARAHMQSTQATYAAMNDAHLHPSQQRDHGQPQPQYHQVTYAHGPPLPPNAILTGHGQGGNGLTSQRWPIPPAHPIDARHRAGSREQQKKTKKRTKTGCLTCRKRRIKCDEEKPECRNCQKSKRECLGYEQIKEPRENSPANIQPAPLGSTPNAQNHLAIAPLQPYPGRSPASEVSAAGSSQGALPPGPDPSFRPGRNNHDSPHYFRMARGTDLNALLPQRKVKYIDIEDLFSLNDIPPSFDVREAPPALDPMAQRLVENFFNHHYMSPLDNFFETTWYSANGLACIRQNPILNDFVFQVAQRMRDQVDPAGARYATSLEARLVWKLAIMPRGAAAAGLLDPLVDELVPRIDAVEKLYTGQFLDPERVPHVASAPEQVALDSSAGADHSATQQTLSFWHHLCRFASLRDDAASTSTIREIDGELLTMRNLLDQKETRDILYSIAILRFVGGRTPHFHPQRLIIASTNNADENTNKLKVAQAFLDREVAHGTDQVTQRMSAMALRGLSLWRQP